MLGRRLPVESHSSPAAFKLPGSFDPLRTASTLTLSRVAPVECTATRLVALSTVDPLSGTIVTSEISCLSASAAVVVVVVATACLLGPEPFPLKAPVRSRTATSTTTTVPLSSTVVLRAMCPRRIVFNRRAALPPTKRAYEPAAAKRLARQRS